MKIKTSELIGPSLDWAVAKCEGHHVYAPNIDWAQAGPIIEGEGIELSLISKNWEAHIAFSGKESQKGPTPLIAAMRCYVAFKLGDEVEVPEELK